jgi:hypothetical protein
MSSARQRTVSHMNKMLTATAVAGAGASCTRAADVQTVTITPLPTVPQTADPTPPPPPLTASATFTAAPPPPPPPPDPSGYLVVDMLPAPARCLGVAAGSKITGKFHRDGGSMVLDLVVSLPTTGTASGTKFLASQTNAWSATVVSSSLRANNTIANVRLQPTTTGSGSMATMGVQLGVSCGSRGSGTLGVNVTYSNPPTESTTPTLSLHDY